MRIAVVGSGIAGLGAAWRLSKVHEVVLFERESRLGGHTHTHAVEQAGGRYAVDSGFIVFNPSNYPLLTRMFDELGVLSQPTTMSFGVQDARTGLEYNATDLDRLFCQRRNLLSPRFWGMVRDILRFYREAPALPTPAQPHPKSASPVAARDRAVPRRHHCRSEGGEAGTSVILQRGLLFCRQIPVPFHQ